MYLFIIIYLLIFPNYLSSFFHRKFFQNIYRKFDIVLKDDNSRSQLDKVDMVKIRYHAE